MHGEFSNGELQGDGTSSYPDGQEYTGQFVDGLRSGQAPARERERGSGKGKGGGGAVVTCESITRACELEGPTPHTCCMCCSLILAPSDQTPAPL